MEPYQRRILVRVADEIDAYHDGRRSMLELLNNSWGLFEAADLRDPAERDQFENLYLALTSADDARQAWMPAGLGSDEDVAMALAAFETWARALRDGEPEGD